jgi:hypothetical protein
MRTVTMNLIPDRMFAAFGTVLLLLPTASLHAVEPIPAFTLGARILFQGDSITDGNRGRSADPNHILGHGYVNFQAALDRATGRAPAIHWIWDDIHPTYSGHQILADEWERAVREFWR